MNFVSLLIGVILGGAITFFTQYFLWKVQQETKLREKTFDFRFEAYKKLWDTLGRLHYYDRARQGEINYLFDRDHNLQIYLELNEIKFKYGPFYDRRTRQALNEFLPKQLAFYHRTAGNLTPPGTLPDELETIRHLIFENSIKYFDEEVVKVQLNIIESIKLLIKGKKGSEVEQIIIGQTAIPSRRWEALGLVLLALVIVYDFFDLVDWINGPLAWGTRVTYPWLPWIKWGLVLTGFVLVLSRFLWGKKQS
jgi:hypothetical protein